MFLLAATWVVLQESGATRAFVRSMLGRVLATDWALQDAVVDLGQGTLTLTGLRIDDPQVHGHRLAQVDQLRLGIDTNPLGDLLSVHTVEIEGLDLHIDLRTGRVPALADLLRDPTGDARAPKDRLPPIRVRRSRVELQVSADAPPLVLADVNLDLLPERATPSRAHLSGTAHSPEFGLTFTLDGMADLLRTEFQATARMPPLRVDDELLRRLRTYLPGLPATGITGSLQQVVLWFEMRGALADDGTVPGPAAGLVAEARNVNCKLPQIPYPITGASCEFAASTLDGGSLRMAARQSGPQGDLDVRTEMVQLWSEPRFEIRAKGRSVKVDADSISAMQSFADGRDIMAALQPTAGRVDLELFLQRRSDGSEDLEVDVGVTGAEMTYRGFGEPPIGFPLPLTAVSGNVHVGDHVISIDNATGEVRPEAGGGTVHCNGTVATWPDKPTRVAVDLDSPRLRFTSVVRQALGTLLHDGGDLYDEFQPKGACAVAVRIRPMNESGWQVRIAPDDAGITWRGMPVPVEAMSGQIQVRSDGVLFDVAARRGTGTVQARGRMLFPADDSSGDTEIWVAARGLPLDASMRQGVSVLAPDVEAIWAELQPEGRCSAEVTVWRTAPETEFGYDGHLAFHDCRLAPVTLALPVRKVDGSLFLHGRGQEQRIDLDAVRGELPDLEGSGRAIVTAVGSLRRRQGSNEHADLTAVVRDLRLDDRLANALDRIGALSRRTWNVLRPSGIVDMVFHRQRPLAGAPTRQDLTVQLRGVGSDAEMLPQPAREVTGQLRVTDGRVDFADLRARMGPAFVVCDAGHVTSAPDDPTRTEVVFEVNSDRFPVDDNLAKLFEGPMRQAILDRQLHGTARVSKLRLKFLVPPEDSGQPFETTVQGFFQPFDVSLVLGARVEGVHGLVQVFESRVDRTGGTLSGTLENGSFRVFGQPCEALTGGFHADPDRVVFDPLSVRLHGGRIQGGDGAQPLVYTLGTGGQPGSLAANVEFDGINVNDLLEYGGMVMPPYSGTLRGQIRLDELRGADFVDMRGEGRVQLVDGNLGTVPVFTGIYAMVSESDRPRFESASTQFRVGERRIEFKELTLTSPLFQVAGSGSMTMDGYVDIKMTLDTLFGGSADLLVLPPILQAITSRLVRFHLFGPMRDLRAEQRWITQGDPRRLGLVPVPPRLDKPVRPDY